VEVAAPEVAEEAVARVAAPEVAEEAVARVAAPEVAVAVAVAAAEEAAEAGFCRPCLSPRTFPS
jgi:hypothetical protein